MNMKHDHSSSSEHRHHHDHHPGPLWKQLRDWRAWVVVALMLAAAMAAYVLSNSESLWPGGRTSSQNRLPRSLRLFQHGLISQIFVDDRHARSRGANG